MNSKGMYHYIKSPQMWALLDSLEKLHGFARRFNSNTEQRVVLMKAGVYELVGGASGVAVVVVVTVCVNMSPQSLSLHDCVFYLTLSFFVHVQVSVVAQSLICCARRHVVWLVFCVYCF